MCHNLRWKSSFSRVMKPQKLTHRNIGWKAPFDFLDRTSNYSQDNRLHTCPRMYVHSNKSEELSEGLMKWNVAMHPLCPDLQIFRNLSQMRLEGSIESKPIGLLTWITFVGSNCEGFRWNKERHGETQEKNKLGRGNQTVHFKQDRGRSKTTEYRKSRQASSKVTQVAKRNGCEAREGRSWQS